MRFDRFTPKKYYELEVLILDTDNFKKIYRSCNSVMVDFDGIERDHHESSSVCRIYYSVPTLSAAQEALSEMKQRKLAHSGTILCKELCWKSTKVR